MKGQGQWQNLPVQAVGGNGLRRPGAQASHPGRGSAPGETCWSSRGMTEPAPVSLTLGCLKALNSIARAEMFILQELCWIALQQKQERIMKGKHFPLSFFSKLYVWGREICKTHRKM